MPIQNIFSLQSRILSLTCCIATDAWVFEASIKCVCDGRLVRSSNLMCKFISPTLVLNTTQHTSICYFSCDQELLRYSVIRILPTPTVICTAIIVTFHRWTTNVAYLLDVTPRNPLPHQYHLQLFPFNNYWL